MFNIDVILITVCLINKKKYIKDFNCWLIPLGTWYLATLQIPCENSKVKIDFLFISWTCRERQDLSSFFFHQIDSRIEQARSIFSVTHFSSCTRPPVLWISTGHLLLSPCSLCSYLLLSWQHLARLKLPWKQKILIDSEGITNRKKMESRDWKLVCL